MITVHIEPHRYSAAYSAIPLRVSSDNVETSENFKYLISIKYDAANYSSSVPVSDGSNIYTEITTTAAHSFNLGDTILLQDSSNVYQGFYNIIDVPASNKITIDLVLSVPMSGTIIISKVIKYNMLPDLEAEAKLLLNNTIKDFVTQNLLDENEIYDGDDTVFAFDILIGEEKKYVFEFEDNGYFYGVGYGDAGKISFWNSSLTSLAGIPFQIGDQITVQQDLFEWVYDDNFFSSGDLGFTSTNIHNFEVGNTITVTGQITQPAYNGATTVKSVIDAYNLTVYKPHNTSTPTEGGSIFGHPRPTYNATCKIVDINLDGTYGVVISTDIPQAGSSQPIPGTIKFADGRLTTLVDEDEITGLRAYNAYIQKRNYDYNDFDNYVIQSRPSNRNYFSTIYSPLLQYRIETTTKSWLLTHVYNTTYVNGVMYSFYDSSNNLLSKMRLNAVNDNTQDFYVPIGIYQLLSSSNLDLISGTDLSLVTLEDISYYNVEANYFDGVTTNTSRTNRYRFNINTDCSRFDLYHLMWKDSLGSWISYPFKYVNRQKTEVEKKNYYKQEGYWDLTNDTFTYPTYDRGEQTFYARSRDLMTLNSGWVNEVENALIKDMMQSAQLFVQNPAGQLIGCQLINNSQEFFTKDNDDLWNYTFDIRLSMNESKY